VISGTVLSGNAQTYTCYGKFNLYNDNNHSAIVIESFIIAIIIIMIIFLRQEVSLQKKQRVQGKQQQQDNKPVHCTISCLLKDYKTP